MTHIVDLLTNRLIEAIKKKQKKIEIKPGFIKQGMSVFVNCLIDNPAFDSQTKETLTTKIASFGTKCSFSEKFYKEVEKSGIVDRIIDQYNFKEEFKLKKDLGTKNKKSRLLGIPKLEDANDAGTEKSESCTLILTEGDSAKSLAMSGIQVVGRDKFGVFPLKGKFLNVREAGLKQVLENEEVQNLIKIMGFYTGRDYNDLKSLRYGKIMIMTDQDHDGSHIKGLLINFLHHFWPSLLKAHRGFL